MTTQKLTGSYYTPDFLSVFLMKYVSGHFKDHETISILEPSVGDGAFVNAFNRTCYQGKLNQFNFTGIDKIEKELAKAELASMKNSKEKTKYDFLHGDFLDLQNDLKQQYDLIAGNPPYISNQLLSKTQIEICERIHCSANLSKTSVKNIWSSFLIRSCQLLNQDGVLAFVLPAELLQVKFASELRNFLIISFQRIEIFTFNELLFDCKGQDTILLIGYKRHKNAGQYYTHIADTKQLQDNSFVLTKNNSLDKTETKWSHHILASEDLDFIYNLSSRLNKISDYCYSKPGIVTAANSFFIVNLETERRYQLEDFTQPIIQKGLFVNGSLVFSQANLERLAIEGKPSKVLIFNEENIFNITPEVRQYLDVGAKLKIPERYKCLQRKDWFCIPNISTVPNGFFFKRSHLYPKLLKNEANALVTDSAYKIEMKPGFQMNDLIYSFYNSLTLLFSELEGRYYGGGVLELTPSEFKKLPIPYVEISDADFNDYKNDFERKENINEILVNNDMNILGGTLKLSDEEILRVNRIYNTLIQKRLRKL